MVRIGEKKKGEERKTTGRKYNGLRVAICSVLFCSFGQGSSLLWTHALRPFYKQAHCASPRRAGVWLMMCPGVCMTEG